MAFLYIFPIFILHLHILQCLTQSTFYSIPDNPNVGDSVILKCTLTAPEGATFKVTVPELITGDIMTPFSFHTIAQNLNDTRYNGYHIPDYNLTELRGDITILCLKESDFKISFACLQELENDTLFRLTLNLSEIPNVPTTTTTTPTCESLTPTTCLPCELPKTTDPPCFNQTVVDCTVWEALGITSSSLLFLLISILSVLLPLCILLSIYFYKKYNNQHSYNVRSNVTQKSQATSTGPTLQSKKRSGFDTFIDCDNNGVEEVT